MAEAQQEVFQKVVAIIGQHAKNQDALKHVSRDTNITRDLEVNSARFVDIILDFEDKFDLQIDDSDMDRVATVGDAVDLVTRLLN